VLKVTMTRRRVLAAGLGIAGATALGGAGTWLARPSDGPATPSLAELRLATGPAGGVYRIIGGELVAILAERFPATRVSQIPTGASVDNLALLGSRGTDLALAYLDATVAGLAAHKPEDVTAVARLYDAWMHVIVLGSSPLRSFLDLDGRTITAGATGSGSRFTTDRLVELANIRPRIIDASQTEGAELLATGKVDAMLSLTGIPTPAVTRLANNQPVRLIPLGGYAESMESRYGAYYAPAPLPASVYPGVEATDTLTTPNLLLARPDLPDTVVQVVADSLFSERDRIARSHPEANRINVRTAIATAPIRLHPGAMRYFRSAKP
jgi:TRAP transporter TAXI family solute receptor